MKIVLITDPDRSCLIMSVGLDLCLCDLHVSQYG